MASWPPVYDVGVDLRLVEYFIAVVDHGGVTKAAEALYLAQPSLSQAIRNLERQLGVELFNRAGRHMTLTAAGQDFCGPARRALEDARSARAKVEAVKRFDMGRLHLAALRSLTTDVLPALISALQSRHPAIQVHVSDPGGPLDVENAVRNGDAELALTELPLRSAHLASFRLGQQTMVLAMPMAMSSGLPSPLPLDQVKGLPLVLGAAESSKQGTIDGAVERVSENVVVRSAHRETIMSLVTAGVGATFVARGVAEREMAGLAVRETLPRITRDVGIAYRDGPLSPAAQEFLRVSSLAVNIQLDERTTERGDRGRVEHNTESLK